MAECSHSCSINAFGKYFKDQDERHRKRAEALERGYAENDGRAETFGNGEAMIHRRSSMEDIKSSEPESPDSRGLEKAEQPREDRSNEQEDRYPHNNGGESREGCNGRYDKDNAWLWD